MKIAVFGEILWDIFGDDKKIGGAPFNFAAHIMRQGADVDFISRVGDDELGRKALAECGRLGLSTECIGRGSFPTGYCNVTLHDGTPQYDLVRDVAYDHIEIPEGFAGDADAIYFGTLAQRAEDSRAALRKLLNITGESRPEVFFDINIRQDYYSGELINECLKYTTILKISREEIGVLKEVGIDVSVGPEDICRQAAKIYPNLKLIVVTLDSDGAFAFETENGKITYSPKPECTVVSTVGAGDSFGAAFLAAFLKGEDIDICLRKATDLACYVCSNLGAIPD